MMKLLIVRLMVPPLGVGPAAVSAPSAFSSLVDPEGIQQPPAMQARAAFALQEREAAAILIHCTTMAPQTAYSTPALTWRPDVCTN